MAFFDKIKIFDQDAAHEKFAEEIIPAQPSQSAPKQNESWLPETEGQLAVDVYQTDNELVVCSTIAGVNSEDLDVHIENDMITIRGKREKPETVALDSYFCQECYFGPFSRSVVLPVEVQGDQAQANMHNGVLTIRVPKLKQKQTKKLEIKVS